MNQADFIQAVAEFSGTSKAKVEEILKTAAGLLQQSMKSKDEVTLPGIGKFSVAARAARPGRNPRTGAILDIPAKNVPHFSAAKALKDAAAG